MTRFTRLATLAGLACASVAQAQSLHYEGGLSLASGTYIFTERTTSWTLSTGLALSAGPVTLRASLPLFVQNSYLLTSSGSGLLPTGGTSSGVVADSSAARNGRGGGNMGRTPAFSISSSVVDDSLAGPVEVPSSTLTGYEGHTGDPIVGATMMLGSGRLGAIFGAAAKVPVNDPLSYGTGAWDVGGSLSLSYLVGRSTAFALDASYWYMGDMPDLELQNTLLLTASVSYLGLRGWGLSGSFSTTTSPVDGFPSATSLTAGILRVGRRQSVGVSAGLGVSEVAADFTIALSWRIALAGS